MLRTKKKIKIETRIVDKILDDGDQARSIIEIKKKYDLDFPFQVKRVKKSPNKLSPSKIGDIVIISGFLKNQDNIIVSKNTDLLIDGDIAPYDCEIKSYVLA